MDQARPQQAKRRRKGDRAFKIGRPAPHLTPSGGGHTPTPDRSKTPAIGSALKRVDSQRPVTEAPARRPEVQAQAPRHRRAEELWRGTAGDPARGAAPDQSVPEQQS